jgi:hypothetical protein
MLLLSTLMAGPYHRMGPWAMHYSTIERGENIIGFSQIPGSIISRATKLCKSGRDVKKNLRACSAHNKPADSGS